MDDYRHLRKSHDDDEDDKQTLLGEEKGEEVEPLEAKECLDQMKHISELITEVTFYSQ